MAAAAKAAFVDSLRAALACDADCATLVLLCIMSNIQERVAGEAIGSYSLNLRMPPASTCGAARSRCALRFLFITDQQSDEAFYCALRLFE